MSIAFVCLLDLAQHVINSCLDFSIGQIGCAALGRHGVLAAESTLVKRLFASRNAWRPGSLVVNLRGASDAGVVASAANSVVNGSAILRAGSCCWRRFG